MESKVLKVLSDTSKKWYCGNISKTLERNNSNIASVLSFMLSNNTLKQGLNGEYKLKVS